MANESIPGVVRQLIAERLDSIRELEAVLLFREDHTRHWTPDEAGRRLYVSTTVATYILEQLADRGLLARDGEQYRHQPESQPLADAVDQLASAYSRHLVAVTHLVHAKPGQGSATSRTPSGSGSRADVSAADLHRLRADGAGVRGPAAARTPARARRCSSGAGSVSYS